jgi:hypothetical protein
MEELKVTSSSFGNRGLIPKKYTCDGEDVNPPLKIENIPEEGKSLVLIVDDPDAPMGTWVHWVVWNIPARKTVQIEEDSIPGMEGLNDFMRHSYGGPCPPSGSHRYFFKVYVLDTKLDIDKNSRKEDVERAMEGHILAKGELVGIYSRKR